MKNLKLKAARAALDMSQQDLADKVGVSRQTINAIEKGDYNPTINLCRSICKVLGKTLDEGKIIIENNKTGEKIEVQEKDFVSLIKKLEIERKNNKSLEEII